jgi:hypothetical protein
LSDEELAALGPEWSGGRSIDGRGRGQATALMWAARNYPHSFSKAHDPKVHDRLIDRLLQETDVHLVDADGCNALWYAFSNPGLAQKIMDHGLDPNVMPSCDEPLLFSLASYCQDEEEGLDFEAFKALATLFIDGGANPTLTDADGKSWAHLSFSGEERMQKFMQDKACEFEQRLLDTTLLEGQAPTPGLRTRL